jgi:hypothetical protein
MLYLYRFFDLCGDSNMDIDDIYSHMTPTQPIHVGTDWYCLAILSMIR